MLSVCTLIDDKNEPISAREITVIVKVVFFRQYFFLLARTITIKLTLHVELQKKKKKESMQSTGYVSPVTICTLHTTNLQYANYREKQEL